MKRLKFPVGIFLYCSLSIVFGQNSDSLKILELKEEFHKNVYSEPQTARIRMFEALGLSKKIGNCSFEGQVYNLLGITYDVTSDYDSALFCYGRAIELAELCDKPLVKAEALNNIGLIYWNTGELDIAIEKYTESLKIFERFDKLKGVANTLSNISIIYTDKTEYGIAANFQKRALAIREKIEDTYGMSVSYANLGNLYIDFNQPDSARYFINQSIKLKKTLNDLHGLGINYNNLAVVFKQEGKTDSAIIAVSKAKDIRASLGDRNNLAYDYFTLGGLYQDKGMYKQAYSMVDSAEALAIELDSKTLLHNIYKRFIVLDTITGDFEGAVAHFAQRLNYQEELFNIEKEKVINEIQTRYETEKKEHQLAKNKVMLAEQELTVKRQTTWTIILIAMVVILIISGIFIYKQQQLKQRQLKEEARLQEELAKAEVKARVQEERVRISRDLHDHIGSQLTIIAGNVDNLAYTEKDEKRKASLYAISDNGRDTMMQLRETIWAMNQESVDVEALIAKTREFAMRLREENKVIEIKSSLTPAIPLSPVVAINLYRIIQESVNNAWKHSGFTRLEISFEKEGDTLVVKIVDNGCGFDSGSLKESSFGLSNIRQRVKEFHAEVNIVSRKGEGTSVEIRLPVNRANYV